MISYISLSQRNGRLQLSSPDLLHVDCFQFQRQIQSIYLTWRRVPYPTASHISLLLLLFFSSSSSAKCVLLHASLLWWSLKNNSLKWRLKSTPLSSTQLTQRKQQSHNGDALCRTRVCQVEECSCVGLRVIRVWIEGRNFTAFKWSTCWPGTRTPPRP